MSDKFIVEILANDKNYLLEFETNSLAQSYLKDFLGVMEAASYNDGFIKVFENANEAVYVRSSEVYALYLYAKEEAKVAKKRSFLQS